MSELDEREYQKLTETALRSIEEKFGDADPEAIEMDRAGDVITFIFKNGRKAVLNTQRPTRQIWFAANAKGWHFRHEAGRWVDEKDPSNELFATIANVVRDATGIDVKF